MFQPRPLDPINTRKPPPPSSSSAFTYMVEAATGGPVLATHAFDALPLPPCRAAVSLWAVAVWISRQGGTVHRGHLGGHASLIEILA